MTATTRFIVPDEAKREMKKTTHKIDSLNGQSKEAQEFINPEVFSSPAAIEAALKMYCGNAQGPMAFNNDTKYLDEMNLIKKELMPHMTTKATLDFLMGNEQKKKDIIENVIKFLGALDIAESETGKVAEFKKLAEKAVESAKGILAKIQNVDAQVEKKVLDAIKKCEAEINVQFPSSEKLKTLTESLDAVAGELTDNSEVDAARANVKEFVLYANKELSAEDTPPGTKDFFAPKLKNLEEIAKGKNPYAIQAEIDSLGRELHQKTSKEVLMKDTSLNFVINSMVRMTLLKIFKITGEVTFAGVTQKLITEYVKPAYTQYLSGLGRLAKNSSNSDEVFGDICLHTFSLIVDELVKVNRGIDDLSITHKVPYTVPFNVVDKVFSDLQIVILNLKPTQIESDAERYVASEKLIREIRDFIKLEFVNAANLSEAEVNILLAGPAFEMTLKLIPKQMQYNFMASLKKAEVKNAVS